MYKWIKNPKITAIKLIIIPIYTHKIKEDLNTKYYKKTILTNNTKIEKEISKQLKKTPPLFERERDKENFLIEQLTIKTLWDYEYKNIFENQIWVPIIIYDKNKTEWYTKTQK